MISLDRRSFEQSVFVNNHLLCYWPTIHNLISKICSKFQVLRFHFFKVDDLHDWWPPPSRALLPTFCTNCPDGPLFARMVVHFAQNTTPIPCSLLSSHTLLLGICMHTKHPNSIPKHPFSWPELQSGQIELPSGQNETHLGNVYKSGQLF